MNRRVILLVVLTVMLSAPWLVGFSPPRQDDGTIRLFLETGYDRIYRPEGWTPLQLTVANDGPDVRGTLRVRSENNNGIDGAVFSTAIDLPQSSRKQVFLNVVLNPYARQLTVELVAANGAILATTTEQITPAEPRDVLTAVITDSPSGSVDLSGLNLGAGRTFQANWTIENIPAQSVSLAGLDVILFNDVDTGHLSLDQQTALTDWVRAGGHLIVTGGPNYRLTAAGLADLLPLAATRTTTTDDLTTIARYSGVVDDALVEPDVILASGDLVSDASPLAQIDGQPVIARRIVGGGVVDYLAFDPGLAPFRRWTNSAQLWDTLIFTARQVPGWAGGVQDWVQARNVIEQAPGFALPSAFQLLGMLIVYIIVIGPVNYIILRILGRRELAWITIPVVVVLFTILSYSTGLSLRGVQATITQLNIVQVWADSDRAQVDGLVGLLSPRRQTYNLIAPSGFTLRPIAEDAGGLTTVQMDINVNQGEAYRVDDVLVDASLIAGFATSGFTGGVPQINSQLTLTYLASDQGGGVWLDGTLTNTTGSALENAVVLYLGGFEYLGALEAGETVSLDAPLSALRSVPFALSTAQPVMAAFGGGLDITVADIMGPNYVPQYNYYQSADMEERLLQQRRDFLQAFIAGSDTSGGRGDRAYLVGWAKTSPLAMTLEGAAWSVDEVSLYIYELPLTADQPDGAVIIPPGLSTWVVADRTANDLTPYNFTLSGVNQTAFRYVPLPSAQLDTINRITINARRTSPAPGTVRVWNWQTSDWEQVDFDGGIRALMPNPAPYIGANNAVMVRVDSTDPNDYVSYANVDVTWEGLFD